MEILTSVPIPMKMTSQIIDGTGCLRFLQAKSALPPSLGWPLLRFRLFHFRTLLSSLLFSRSHLRAPLILLGFVANAVVSIFFISLLSLRLPSNRLVLTPRRSCSLLPTLSNLVIVRLALKPTCLILTTLRTTIGSIVRFVLLVLRPRPRHVALNALLCRSRLLAMLPGYFVSYVMVTCQPPLPRRVQFVSRPFATLLLLAPFH